MKSVKSSNVVSQICAGLLFWLLLFIAYTFYAPDAEKLFYFDDQVNLHNLNAVQNGHSAWLFVASGEAGPLGRPIALASFLLNVPDWPHNPAGFVRINIFIHLLNGVLVCWLVLRMVGCVSLERNQRSAEWIAVSSAALWLMLPLLASTALLSIQRMTSLSATFVLGGLLVYVFGLSWQAVNRLQMGRRLQITGILCGTLLAVFTKENGALLPLYALALEVTILSGVASVQAGRRWRMLLLALPSIVLIVYLMLRMSPNAYVGRDFTLDERLLTQPLVLWDYVRLAFLPRALAFTPFHDDYPISHGLFDPPWTILALIAWIGIFGLTLWKRRHWPLLALAVFWFLGGHLLESTALPLELYFEHRNYLPMIGPTVALAWFAWTVKGTWQYWAPALLALYIALQAFLLEQTTSLWGQPLLAGEIWAIQHPGSARAQQFLAQRYLLLNEPGTAYKALSQGAKANPKAIDLALQALQLSCQAGLNERSAQDYALMKNRCSNGSFSNATLDTSAKLLHLVLSDQCAWLEEKKLHSIFDALLSNQNYQAATTRNYLHHLKSRLYRHQGDLDGTVKHLQAAFQAKPDLETTLLLIGTLQSMNLHKEAASIMEHARTLMPSHPVIRTQWKDMLDRIDSS